MLIESGTGNGHSAGVTTENRIMVQSTTSSNEHHVNHQDGLAFNALFLQTPGAGNCFFYMKNGSETDLCVEGITLAVAAACSVFVEVSNTGTPAGDDLTPANLNRGSGKSATGTFMQGTDLGSGSLATGTEIERYVFAGASDSSMYNFNQDVILPKNETLTIWCTASLVVTGLVIFNYHSVTTG